MPVVPSLPLVHESDGRRPDGPAVEGLIERGFRAGSIDPEPLGRERRGARVSVSRRSALLPVAGAARSKVVELLKSRIADGRASSVPIGSARRPGAAFRSFSSPATTAIAD